MPTSGYHERDTDKHIQLAHDYASLPVNERDEFFSKHGVRWFEFARLPYFDPIRMTIIDPMHNLLIGMYMLFSFTMLFFRSSCFI